MEQKKSTPRRRIASKNHSAGEGTKALARPPIAGGVGRSDRVGNCTTRIRQEFSESDDYFDYLQVLQYYPRRIFRPAPLPAERKINPSGASAAAIAGANPITGKQITEKQINSKQEPAATIGNGQRTKKKGSASAEPFYILQYGALLRLFGNGAEQRDVFERGVHDVGIGLRDLTPRQVCRRFSPNRHTPPTRRPDGPAGR